MKKIWGWGVVAGVVMLVVSMAVDRLFNLFIPGLSAEYENPGLFRSMTDPLMTLYFICPIIVGIIMAFIWAKVKSVVPAGTIWRRGWLFGLVYWLATCVPGMIITYGSMPASLTLVISWTVSGLVTSFLAAVVLVRANP